MSEPETSLEERISNHLLQHFSAKEYRVNPRDLPDMAKRLGARVHYADGVTPGPLTMMLRCQGIPAHIVTDESVPAGAFETAP